MFYNKFVKPLITDSTGSFQFAWVEKYFWNEPKIKLNFHNELLKDTLITLHSGRANLNILVTMEAIK
jgi:hypothetical protein